MGGKKWHSQQLDIYIYALRENEMGRKKTVRKFYLDFKKQVAGLVLEVGLSRAGGPKAWHFSSSSKSMGEEVSRFRPPAIPG